VSPLATAAGVYPFRPLFEAIETYADRAFEFIAVLVLVVGGIETIVGLALSLPHWRHTSVKRAVWVRFAGWILIALEFTLAADIIRTAIAPTWNEIGQLGAIAFIRTALSLFLERDIDKYEAASRAASQAS
jgi:uncharacterized membrane protein